MLSLLGLSNTHVYVQDLFNEMLAKFFVLHHFQKHKVVGKSHGIPVNRFKITQFFTCLSDRHDSFRNVILA
jgi:hypothetical protein